MVASGIRVGTPCGHHAGHARGGDEGGRLADRPRGAGRRRDRRRARRGREVAEAVSTLVRQVPRLPARRRSLRAGTPGPRATDARARVPALVLLASAAVTYLTDPGSVGGMPCGGTSWPRSATATCTTIPIPRLGGVAMYLGLLAGMLRGQPARRSLGAVFTDSRDAWAVLTGGTPDLPGRGLDDIWGLDAADQAGRPDHRRRRHGAPGRPAAVAARSTASTGAGPTTPASC